MTEMCKLIVTVVYRYDFTLQTPTVEVRRGWFQRIEDFHVTVTKVA